MRRLIPLKPQTPQHFMASWRRNNAAQFVRDAEGRQMLLGINSIRMLASDDGLGQAEPFPADIVEISPHSSREKKSSLVACGANT